MARATSLQIRETMADLIREHYADNVTELTFQVEPRMVFNPTPPTVDIVPNTPARDPSTEGMGDLHGAFRFYVRMRVAGDEEEQQEILFGAMDEADDLCIAIPLTDDPTLNGYATDVEVGSPTGFELATDITDRPLMSVRWPVLVIAGES